MDYNTTENQSSNVMMIELELDNKTVTNEKDNNISNSNKDGSKTCFKDRSQFLNFFYDFAVGASADRNLLLKLQLLNLLFGIPEVNL